MLTKRTSVSLEIPGAPYITHPIAVAEILASWHMDAQVIEAGLMHDVLEDTAISKIEMSEKVRY